MFGAYKFSRLVKFSGFNIGFDAPINPQEHAKEVLPVGVSVTTPLFPPPEGSYELPFQVDANGSLWTHVVGALGPVTGTIPVDNLPPPAAPLDVVAYSMVYDRANNDWDRWSSMLIPANGAPVAMPTIGTPVVGAAAFSFDLSTSLYKPLISATYGADGLNPATSALTTLSNLLLYNGNTLERQRTPSIFKTVSTAALGSTAVWTPTAGKRFRLMRVHMSITSNAAAAAASVLLSRLLDGATFFGLSDNNYIPLVGTIQQHQNFIFDLGNGYLSTAINNVLNIDLSFALTAGVLDVTVAGTEE